MAWGSGVSSETSNRGHVQQSQRRWRCTVAVQRPYVQTAGTLGSAKSSVRQRTLRLARTGCQGNLFFSCRAFGGRLLSRAAASPYALLLESYLPARRALIRSEVAALLAGAAYLGKTKSAPGSCLQVTWALHCTLRSELPTLVGRSYSVLSSYRLKLDALTLGMIPQEGHEVVHEHHRPARGRLHDAGVTAGATPIAQLSLTVASAPLGHELIFGLG